MVHSLSKGAKSTNPRSGFTLVELLVVITVIALLLAILLPALRKVKVLTKRVVCKSNLKQLALAWQVYLDGNDGYFYQGINANLNYGGWKGMVGWSPRPLNSHLNFAPVLETKSDAKVFCCPADGGGVPGYALRQKAYIYLGTSYQTNIFLIGQDSCRPFSTKTQALDGEISKRLPKLNRNRVDDPSRLLLIGDYGWINQWKPRPHPHQEWKELAEWHGRADYHVLAFLDGHCEFLNIRKGFYVTDEYNVLPFEDLYGLAREVQGQ
jgi:prepilin-type N-terminal cleavage/methylation domain-containing protein